MIVYRLYPALGKADARKFPQAEIAPNSYPALGRADARNEGGDRSALLPLAIPHQARREGNS